MNAHQQVHFPQQQAAELAHKLAQCIEGEVHFDDGHRALYATDGSLYRQVPIGVVVPKTVDDLCQTLAVCREAGAPIVARGAGTSLAGQTCNVAVVVDCSKYLDRLLEIDPNKRLAKVQPGCVLDTLRDAAEKHHLTFGPDPSTHAHNTLGGMLGNNSCGVHSVMAGRTSDNVRSMDILTYDGLRLRVGPTSESELEQIIAAGGRRGEIYDSLKRLRDKYADLIRNRYPDIPRRVSGYNLDSLLPENGFNVARALVGSEGTCVTILEAELELVPSPPKRSLLVLAYEDVYGIGDHVANILQYKPLGLEGMDEVLMSAMRHKNMFPGARQMLPEGGGWLLVEFGGSSQQEANDRARELMDNLHKEDRPPRMRLFEDADEQQAVWDVREAGLGATARAPGQGTTYPGWEDASVPPAKVGEYLRDFRDLLHRFGYEGALYGHFGDGCVHSRINFTLESEEGVQQWTDFMHEAADLVVQYGGSLSGEHGDGQVRAELLQNMYGESLLQAFREFKSTWDPANRMNPGKVIDPYPMNQDLRQGPETKLAAVETTFSFAADQHRFSDAVDRCVGIGNCRNASGGVMCPSYRATRDEQHSTRGRARLLFEMLKGDSIRDRWRSKAVHEALDLCLACKGCKSDCPVDVDMATLKAEFMSHHYHRKLRPRAAYSMGLIWWWSRMAAKVPRLANFVLQTPGLSRVAKAIGGIARERDMPHYAQQTFRDWFTRREPRSNSGRRVVLWPDTFNNHFFPETLKSAVRVLESAGFQVQVPRQPLCCGRPLYAEGMLKQAQRQWRDILDVLSEEITDGLPVVGLEPSCVASFRDELPQLFEADERAQRLADNTSILSEFLDRANYRPHRLMRKAVVHMHCHQHASLETEAEHRLLRAVGLDLDVLDAGCCGMAGSFGFAADKYTVSKKIAEDKLLPAIRTTAGDTLIITNGFSCQQQIEQLGGRQALNLAQVLALALDEGLPPEEIIARSQTA